MIFGAPDGRSGRPGRPRPQKRALRPGPVGERPSGLLLGRELACSKSLFELSPKRFSRRFRFSTLFKDFNGFAPAAACRAARPKAFAFVLKAGLARATQKNVKKEMAASRAV